MNKISTHKEREKASRPSLLGVLEVGENVILGSANISGRRVQEGFAAERRGPQAALLVVEVVLRGVEELAEQPVRHRL